jgi:hypothetical protein
MNSDHDENFQICEIVREKILTRTQQEIPHSVAVILENRKSVGNKLYLHMTVIVDKKSQKGILIGKNGKMINKYVLCDFKKYYDLWMKEREELGIESEWLFVSKSADGWEQMKVATLNSWAKSFSRALGVDFYWHSLRHFLTTRMKRYNIPDHIIQEWNQWSTGELVNIYSDIEATDEFGKYFSKNGLVEGKEGSLSDM